MIDWTLAPFDALGGHDVHDLLALRCAVFVVEQHCPYLDADGLDPQPGTRHLLGRTSAGDSGRLVACARSLPPADDGADARIGRVVVARSHRRQGLARELLQRLIRDLDHRLPGVSQRLDAQRVAVPLYESVGFVCSGEPFLEDGIAHVTMRRHAV